MIQETLDAFPLVTWWGRNIVIGKFTDESVKAFCNDCGAWLADWNADHWDSHEFLHRPRLPDGTRGFERIRETGLPKYCQDCPNYIGGVWK